MTRDLQSQNSNGLQEQLLAPQAADGFAEPAPSNFVKFK